MVCSILITLSQKPMAIVLFERFGRVPKEAIIISGGVTDTGLLY